MRRRDFLKAGATGAFGAFLPGCRAASGEPRERPVPGPNIIYIMADDLGYHDLGCYGQDKIATPHIDRMAAEGMRFTDCYSGSPVCAPARSVLMTGQHTGHTRVRDNFAVVGGDECSGGGSRGRVALKPDDVTVAEVLKQTGYTTGISGKWGLGEPGTTGVPNKQGFYEWFGYLNQRRAHDHWPSHLWENGERVDLLRERRSREGFSHHRFTEHCLDFIRTHAGEPFFYYLAYTLPHWPLVMPEDDVGRYADRDWSDEAKAYAAMVSLIDRDVGRILGLLRDLRLDENTLVFFCSDNGASKRWEGLFDSCGEMKGHKGSLQEGGLRVPMVARWPGHVPAGTVHETPWYFADFLPMAAELAGVATPPGIDGISVADTLLGGQQDLAGRFMYWEKPPLRPEGKLDQATRRGRWKALRRGLNGSVRLYDLTDDLAEEENVAGRHPDVAEQFSRYMDQAHVHSPHWPHRGSNGEEAHS